MHALSSSLFLVFVTLSCILAQCPPQASISNTAGSRQLYINHTLAEQPQSGLIKDAIRTIVGTGVQCSDIVITQLRGEFGDGISWGTVADFNLPASAEAAYDASVATPVTNPMTNAMRTQFPAGGAAITALKYSDLKKFLLNAQNIDDRNNNVVVTGQNQNSTGVAAQPCQVSEWSQCDGCKRDKNQIVTRTITKPAVGGGTCVPTQMRVYCNRKCLTDWQIGLIALACFLFLVVCCICCYCVCVRRRRPDDAKARAQQKERELATPPFDEKIDVEVVDPVRPSSAGTADEPNFHRSSNETVTTGPRPTATFHEDDEPAETKPTPVPEEEPKSSEPTPVVAPPAGAPRANVVRVHL